MSLRIGIDLGGTKIEAVALDADGAERFRRRIDDAARRLRRHAAPRSPIWSATSSARPARRGTRRHRHARRDLAGDRARQERQLDLAERPSARARPRARARRGRCASRTTRTASRCRRRADGAAAGARVVFGVILGTGTGGGIVVDGRVLTGANAIAGEWGHNPLPWPRRRRVARARRATAAQRGCIETFLSGAGCRSALRRRRPPDGARDRGCADAAATSACRPRRVELYAHRLAKALASVINVLDPDVIVLGGGLSNIESLYHAVPAALDATGSSPTASTRGSSAPATATRAASAARPGCGRRLRPE